MVFPYLLFFDPYPVIAIEGGSLYGQYFQGNSTGSCDRVGGSAGNGQLPARPDVGAAVSQTHLTLTLEDVQRFCMYPVVMDRHALFSHN